MVAGLNVEKNLGAWFMPQARRESSGAVLIFFWLHCVAWQIDVPGDVGVANFRSTAPDQRIAPAPRVQYNILCLRACLETQLYRKWCFQIHVSDSLLLNTFAGGAASANVCANTNRARASLTLTETLQVLKSNYMDVHSGSADSLRERLANTVESNINRVFLKEQLEEKETQQRKRKKDSEDLAFELMPNKYFALALDKCLQKTMQVGLSYFEPKNKELLLQKREVLALAELPDTGREEGSSSSRAVARKDGRDRILAPREVRNGQLHRPALHRAQDEGSIGWPCSLWLDNCVQLRGSTTDVSTVSMATTSRMPWLPAEPGVHTAISRCWQSSTSSCVTTLVHYLLLCMSPSVRN